MKADLEAVEDLVDVGQKASNYLTRIARAQDRRRWPRRECNILVGALFAQKGVRQIVLAQMRLVNISEGGAYAAVRRDDFPDHFYIYLGDFQYFIGCAVVSRIEGGLHLRFIVEQETEFVDIVGRITDPFEFRGEIRPSLYGLKLD